MRVAQFDSGSVAPEAVRDALATVSDRNQRRAIVEQVVRARLLAFEAERAGLHRTPEFVNRYAEELARLYVDRRFAEPFKKKLPTDDEVRKFFDENKDKLGRPERVRLAHVVLLAPASDAAARAEKRGKAEKISRTLGARRRTSTRSGGSQSPTRKTRAAGRPQASCRSSRGRSWRPGSGRTWRRPSRSRPDASPTG
jgi:hypothetical protein